MAREYYELEEVLKSWPGKVEMINHKESTVLYLGKVEEEITLEGGYKYKQDKYCFMVDRIQDGKRIQILKTDGYGLADQLQALTCFMNNTDPMPMEEAKRIVARQQQSDAYYNQEKAAHEQHHRRR